VIKCSSYQLGRTLDNYLIGHQHVLTFICIMIPSYSLYFMNMFLHVSRKYYISSDSTSFITTFIDNVRFASEVAQ